MTYTGPLGRTNLTSLLQADSPLPALASTRSRSSTRYSLKNTRLSSLAMEHQRHRQRVLDPSEELDDFNANIVGPIEVIAEYR
jgi:hypothetical protein